MLFIPIYNYQILFAVAKDDSSYYKPSFVRRRLESSIGALKIALGSQALLLKTEVCRRDLCVRGDCRDVLTMSDTNVCLLCDIHNKVIILDDLDNLPINVTCIYLPAT